MQCNRPPWRQSYLDTRGHVLLRQLLVFSSLQWVLRIMLEAVCRLSASFTHVEVQKLQDIIH